MEEEPKFHYNEELYAEYKDKVSRLLKMQSLNDVGEVWKKFSSKQGELQSKYPNATEYAMYLVLGSNDLSIGVGTDLEIKVTADDFPGKDSVAEFIDELAKSYNIQ